MKPDREPRRFVTTAAPTGGAPPRPPAAHGDVVGSEAAPHGHPGGAEKRKRRRAFSPRITSKRAGFFTLGAIAVAALAAGCGGDDSDDSEAAADGGTGTTSVEFLLPFNESISFYPLLVARAEGYFADEGLEVDSVVADSGASVVQQLAAGNADFALTNAENILIGASRGADLRAIYETNNGIFTIAVPEDSEVESVEDLNGEVIGLTDVAGGEVPLVRSVLDEAGLEENDDVQLPAVGPGGPAVFAALESGDIAAYAGANNDLAGVEAAGLELRPILPESFENLPANYVTVTEGVLDDPEQQEIALGIARAWHRAIEFSMDNPERAFEISCEAVPEECQEPESAQAFFDASFESYEPAEGSQPGDPNYDGLNTLLESVVADDADGDVDIEAVFPDQYLETIRPGG